jgi:tetratricopeptide (TPR) repeat protein
MDWTDKLSIAAIVGLALITTGMVGNHEMAKKGHEDPSMVIQDSAAYAARIEAEEKIYEEVASFEEQGRHGEAMTVLSGIMEKYPEKSLSYVHLARLNMSLGQLADSVKNYRRAVEMEPDYVDKKAPLFIGQEIKKVVKEGVEKLKREKKLRPKDQQIKIALKDVYYLQRRLAGGCE